MITVVRDSTIKLPDIEIPLLSSDYNESGQMESRNQIMQTKVYGIQCPLLAVNGMGVPFDNFTYLELDSTGTTPKVSFEFMDTQRLFQFYNPRGTHNILQLQIIPPFDDAYKKINLLFYLSEFSVSGNVVSGTGTYKNNEFTNDKFKCLGELNTWDLCDKISAETGLGYASDTRGTSDDRYIYLDHKSYEYLLDDEIEISESSSIRVLDWWIDWWNNLTLCDIYNRVNSKDSFEDMLVWISRERDRFKYNQQDNPKEPNYCRTVAQFSNHYTMQGSELYVKDYEQIGKPGTCQSNGSQRIISIYNENKKEYIDNIIMDGDVQDDDFMRFEYAGEVYGDYDYVNARALRDMYLDKLTTEKVVIYTNSPNLGIYRGSQVGLFWYVNSQEKKFAENVIGHTPLDDYLKEYESYQDNDISPTPLDVLSLDKQVSGRYTVMGMKYIYKNHRWSCEYTLIRPFVKERILD